jgi:hypothetical protein
MRISDIIKSVETYEFSNEDIDHILNDQDCTVIDANLFDKLESLTQLASNEDLSPVALITLLTRSADVRHWITIILKPADQLVEIYDSYGFPIDKDLELAVANSGRLLELLKDITRTGWKVSQNTVGMQQLKNGINTCGAHSIMRCKFRHLTNAEYVSMIVEYSRDHKMTPDELVTLMLINRFIR